MPRMTLAIAVCAVAALAAAPAVAQEATGSVPAAPFVAPAPDDSSAIPAQTLAPQPAPSAEGKATENPPAERPSKNSLAESKPDDADAETKAAEKADGRFTFSRIDDGYVRLDNRTGQVSFCSKRTVGWTCQLAPDDRGVLENEIGRLQEENASLKRNLLANGLPLPGSMKADPPVVQQNERTLAPPSDPNIDRMKVIVEKAWRRLVEFISTLQKDVLKKS